MSLPQSKSHTVTTISVRNRTHDEEK